MPGHRVTRWYRLALLTLGVFCALLPATSVLGQEEGRKVRLKVTPDYPAIARQMRLAGAVRLEVVISPNGLVKAARVLGGHPLLAQAAVEAVKKWKFEPAPRETTQTIEFRFNPSGAGS